MTKHARVGVNDLASQRPDLAVQWHTELNGELLPSHVTEHSHKKVWWLCSVGHSWESTIINRSMSDNASCPVCLNKIILKGYNDLETRYPSLSTEWDTRKNHIALNEVQASSRTKYWWICDKNHSWETSVAVRIGGSGCPRCAKIPSIDESSSLASTHPHIALLWDTDNNDDVTPQNVTARSGRAVNWRCEHNHQWQDRVIAMSKKKSLCPYCSGRMIKSGFNDAATIYPHLASLWGSENEMSLSELSPNSRDAFIWTCDHGHTMKRTIAVMAKSIQCTTCMLAEDSLAVTKPEIAAQLHPTKNGDTDPTLISAKSRAKVWWECPQDGYEWQSAPASRTSVSCPVCLGKVVFEGLNDLASVNPSVASQWHPTKNGDLQPTQVTAGAKKKAWWQCEQDHEWESTINNMTRNTIGCPYCSGAKVIKGHNDLVTKRPDISQNWHPTKNGQLLPDDLSVSSGIKVWWLCEKGHEWEAYPYNRINTGCPQCCWSKNVPESEIAAILDSWGIAYTRWARKVLPARRELDFYLPDHNFAIEFNGIYWHSEAAGKDKGDHLRKHQECEELGITLYQIWEDDWKHKKEIIIRGLAYRLGKTHLLGNVIPEISPYHQQTVGARKCVVEELAYDAAKSFLDENHIQGSVRGSHYLGLRDMQNVLRAVLVITRSQAGIFSIDRYASAGIVPGGFTRLLKHAEKTIPEVEKWVTFADLTVSNGSLYSSTGFTVDKVLAPDYMYVVNHKRVHKFNYRLKRFRTDPNLVWEPQLTEKELAKINGLNRIWDAGKIRYVKNVIRKKM
jgi:Probable Zinc-ribbon domain